MKMVRVNGSTILVPSNPTAKEVKMCAAASMGLDLDRKWALCVHVGGGKMDVVEDDRFAWHDEFTLVPVAT